MGQTARKEAAVAAAEWLGGRGGGRPGGGAVASWG